MEEVPQKRERTMRSTRQLERDRWTDGEMDGWMDGWATFGRIPFTLDLDGATPDTKKWQPPASWMPLELTFSLVHPFPRSQRIPLLESSCLLLGVSIVVLAFRFISVFVCSPLARQRARIL